MNLVIGIVAGALVGWIAFALLNAARQQGLRASLIIGLIGGAVGTQLAPLLSSSAGSDGQFNVFSLVVAVASAAAGLIIANSIARRRSA